MDVHVRRAITVGLRSLGISVLTAQEDGTDRLPDPELLDRATDQARVAFTSDPDLLAEAARRQQTGQAFTGLVFVHQRRLTVGQCIRDWALMAQVYDPEDMTNRVEYLPLK